MEQFDLAQHFCSQPWIYAEIYAGGGVYVCCPAWNQNRVIGNLFTDSFEVIWNGRQAQLFRSEILEGRFGQCDVSKCSLIVGKTLPRRDQIANEYMGSELRGWIADGVTSLSRGPRIVKLGYDSSCNLWCPSCRSELILAKKEEQARLDRLLEKFILPFLRDTETLIMSSDGDPFASKHYRNVMKVTKARFPNMKLALCTHGVLMDEKAWQDCELEGRVARVQISVDAARPETYAIVRRGGDFDRLLRNLEFLGEKRRAAQMGPLDLLFVVQRCNYREMPEFVRLGKRLGVDTIQFMLIDHWARGMDGEEYANAKVWDRDHRLYSDLVSVLNDPIMEDPIVRLGNAQAIREGWQPPELEVTKKGDILRVP
jgi:hypothetical protein